MRKQEKYLELLGKNLKFFKLKSGEFLDLEELELKQFLKLLDSVDNGDLEDNSLEINNSRALYI